MLYPSQTLKLKLIGYNFQPLSSMLIPPPVHARTLRTPATARPLLAGFTTLKKATFLSGK